MMWVGTLTPDDLISVKNSQITRYHKDPLFKEMKTRTTCLYEGMSGAV